MAVAISFYMGVHVPLAITEQPRRRGVDVLTAIEDDSAELPDDQLLESSPLAAHRASTQLNRVLFTQDIRFHALAETWQQEGKPFAGLIFGHQMRGTIGQFVRDLELIAQASDPEEWQDIVEYIPFR